MTWIILWHHTRTYTLVLPTLSFLSPHPTFWFGLVMRGRIRVRSSDGPLRIDLRAGKVVCIEVMQLLCDALWQWASQRQGQRHPVYYSVWILWRKVIIFRIILWISSFYFNFLDGQDDGIIYSTCFILTMTFFFLPLHRTSAELAMLTHKILTVHVTVRSLSCSATTWRTDLVNWWWVELLSLAHALTLFYLRSCGTLVQIACR